MDLFSKAPKPEPTKPAKSKHKTRYDCGCRWDGDWKRCEEGERLLSVYFASFDLPSRNRYFDHYENKK